MERADRLMLSAVYVCKGCGQEADGTWPDAGAETVQACTCGHAQREVYPGYSFTGEAG